MTGTVSEKLLLEGAWYALEHGGRLLESASTLHDADDSATAVALAMFAREDVGRSRLLRILASDVRSGTSLMPAHVRKACRDHIEKQRQAVGSSVIRTRAKTLIDSILRKKLRSPVASDEWRQADAQLKDIHRVKKKRLPIDRNRLRQRALYVDLNDAGTGWHRPVDIDADEAHTAIEDAINDYAGERDRVLDDSEMAKAVEGMSPKLDLPPPRWLIPARPRNQRQSTPEQERESG